MDFQFQTQAIAVFTFGALLGGCLGGSMTLVFGLFIWWFDRSRTSKTTPAQIVSHAVPTLQNPRLLTSHIHMESLPLSDYDKLQTPTSRKE